MRVARSLFLTSCQTAGVIFARRATAPNFIRIQPADIHWQDIPDGRGAQIATLAGDPDKPGLYVIRVKFPPYIMDLPHWHPNTRYVTVLQGTWYSGTGIVFDLKRAVP